MESGSNIRLDPDVDESVDINRIPLCDLYGLPVFTEDTDRKAGERRTDRQNMLAYIRREVFEDRDSSEDEMLCQIRSQIFQVTQEHIVAEPSEKAEILPETGYLSGLAFTGIVILLLGLRKIWRLDRLPEDDTARLADSLYGQGSVPMRE